ncbi:MAG TPA: beta-propeller fold lactonase family protein [Bryobacteraceae bacterium]|nr:beta-propeller fold lactonase family protein [Bryobacteraceae bacterium]
MIRPLAIALALLAAAILHGATAGKTTRYPSPDDMVLSGDGSRLYVVCGGSDEMVVVDRATGTVAARIPVGRLPRGIAISPDGSHIYVANSWSDNISEIDAANMKVVRKLPAGFEPTGVALDGQGKFLYAANRIGGDVSVIELASGIEERRLVAGRGASWLTSSADGSRIYVTHIYPNIRNFRTQPESEITEIDTASRRVVSRLPLHNVGGVFHISLTRDGRLGLAGQMRPKNLIPLAHVEHGWAFGNSLAVFGDDIGGVVQLPLDAIEDYFSLPFGVAIAPDRAKAYISASGSNEVAILDLHKLVAAAKSPDSTNLANDLSAASRYLLARVPVGRNPRSVVLSRDGGTLYVANRLDDTISVLDTARGEVTATIPLGGPAELTPERRGERLFYSSQYAFGNQFGCANCHLDATIDGLSWDLEPDGFGVDIVDNRSLEEVADTAPFKWNGQNPDLQTECGPRTERFFFRSAGFRGDDLEDLVSFIKSIPLRPNRYRLPDGQLTPAQERGKAIFNRTVRKNGTPIPDELQCFVCHAGPHFTSQALADVGTGKPTDRSPEIDIPHLTNVAYSAPYLHDGSARSLEEIWTVFNPNDKHGVTNDLSKDELNDLIEYLKTI